MFNVEFGYNYCFAACQSNNYELGVSALAHYELKLNHMDFVLNVNKATQNPYGILYWGTDVVDLIICETA